MYIGSLTTVKSSCA